MLALNFIVALVLCCAIASTYAFRLNNPSFKRFNRFVSMNGISIDDMEDYGKNLFKGTVADQYLKKNGLSHTILDSGAWVHDESMLDKVAASVLEWAKDNGATSYCHWFQPLGSSGLRHGNTACVQMAMMEFDNNGKAVWDFKGKNLLRGETDGSSYPNGGLRATHRAGAYLTVDPTSPMFIRDDVVYIPAGLMAFTGESLDEKIPLLRATDALSNEGTRLLNLLGYKVKEIKPMIGLEQEIFLIPRDAYNQRPDLQLAGRTVMGTMPARGQELSDHYMAPLSHATEPLECMKAIQEECFRLGIPLRTRHREVAPNQFEFAPQFGTVNTQIDQNLLVMQIIEEVATRYGLAALIQEKPFQGVNGSGKHNNWSLATEDGTNLLNVGQLAKNSGSEEIFPVIMAAILKAVNENGDLMRLAIASPGNDFRLGACEAPPAIVSVYLGEDMTNFLESYSKGENKSYKPNVKLLSTGTRALPKIEIPAQDRNRSSPFPYGGHRFEFRAVGSSQNVSLVNTILAMICAKAFKEFADEIEKGKKPRDVATAALKDAWKVVFNGNGYDPANQEMLTKKGLWRIDSGVDAISRFTEAKNIKLFEEMNVLTGAECQARQNVMFNHYIGTVEIEAGCMKNMIVQHVIPSVEDSQIPGPVLDQLKGAVKELEIKMHEIHDAKSLAEKAQLSRKLRLETMINIREICDKAESLVPQDMWTLATYKELLFIDQTAN